MGEGLLYSKSSEELIYYGGKVYSDTGSCDKDIAVCHTTIVWHTAIREIVYRCVQVQQ
jgi:hypothetical protein